MSNSRQTLFERVGDRTSAVVPYSKDYSPGHIIPLHFHNWDQLVYASRGVMTVRTEQSMWVVPTRRAVWIPKNRPHTITMSGSVYMRTLYMRVGLVKSLPRGCCVVNVSPLLSELILHICRYGVLRRTVAIQRHLIDVVIDQLREVQLVPLQLVSLEDQRAQRVAAAMVKDPGTRMPLEEICKLYGASRRTIERLFEEETGMTLGKWQQQLRLLHALQLLAEGAKITHTALETGYSTPSAFIAAFRRSLGTTPALYFKSPAGEG
jgi:AraC-like DNA-binding protein